MEAGETPQSLEAALALLEEQRLESAAQQHGRELAQLKVKLLAQERETILGATVVVSTIGEDTAGSPCAASPGGVGRRVYAPTGPSPSKCKSMRPRSMPSRLDPLLAP